MRQGAHLMLRLIGGLILGVGLVSVTTFSAAAQGTCFDQDRFGRFDTNQDGALSLAELEAAGVSAETLSALESLGVTQVQLRDCGGDTGTGTGGTDTGTGGDGTGGDDTPIIDINQDGEQDVIIDTDEDDEDGDPDIVIVQGECPDDGTEQEVDVDGDGENEIVIIQGNCDDDTGTTTGGTDTGGDTGTTTGGTDTGGDTGTTTGGTTGTGTDDGGDNVVDEGEDLPATGHGEVQDNRSPLVLVLSALSLGLLGIGFAWRQRRA